MIQIDFKKNNGLVPVIVQDVHTNQVLMLAYMNEESLRPITVALENLFGSKAKQVVTINTFKIF